MNNYKKHFLILLLAFHTGYAQQSVMNQGKLVSTSVYHEIPYHDCQEGIKHPVQLQGTTYSFIFDTGAPLAISKELQQKHDYKVLHKSPITDANHSRDTILIVLVDTFKMGSLICADIPAVVLDFKNSPIACEEVSGLIGSNIFRFLLVQFNLEQKKIILTNDRSKLPSFNTNNQHALYLDAQSNAFMEVFFDHSFRDTAHFDSGMSGFYDMNFNKTQQLIAARGAERVIAHQGAGIVAQGMFGAGKPDKQYILKTSSFKCGGDSISNVHFSVTNSASRVGRDWMKYGIITIDYPGKNYYFDPYPGVTNYISKPFFGFQPMATDGKLTAGVVWEGSDAEKKGLVSGMEIYSLNGHLFENINSCEIYQVLRKEFAKAKIKLEIRKNNRKETIELEKR